VNPGVASAPAVNPGVASAPAAKPKLAAAPGAQAILPQLPVKAVVLVMESYGGVSAASELRAALNRQPRTRVISLAESMRQRAQPAAVLTVASDPSRVLSVVYWSQSGEADSLSAPAPAAEQLQAVILALTSALLDRHRVELGGLDIERAGPLRYIDFARTSREFYAMLGRFGRFGPRTSVELRMEDF
jgi:hypothetical protein